MPAKNMGKVMNSQRPFMAGRTSTLILFLHVLSSFSKPLNPKTFKTLISQDAQISFDATRFHLPV